LRLLLVIREMADDATIPPKEDRCQSPNALITFSANPSLHDSLSD